MAKSFNFEIDSDDQKIMIKKSKIDSNVSNAWVYEYYQKEYEQLIDYCDYFQCLKLFNSGRLNAKPRTIRYKVKNKKELKAIVMYCDDETFNNFDLNWLDVSEITNMAELFMCKKYFNCDISEWDVSNVTNMNSMFMDCVNFDQDLSKWDVSNVTDISWMFKFANAFVSSGNAYSISQWDVSNVILMNSVFEGCAGFNAPLNNWDVSNVISMSCMFNRCFNFNQPLDKWDVSNVINMSYMFAYDTDFNQDISMWDVSNVKHNENMFFKCSIDENKKPNLK